MDKLGLSFIDMETLAFCSDYQYCRITGDNR